MNVLFLAVDDLRPLLGCYGDRFAHTPNIDALAARGTLFESAYCQQAFCGPSRASLLTGLRPDTTRVYDLETPFRTAVPNAVTLPQLFKQNGYFVRGIGKIFHGNPVMNDPASWSVPATLNMVTKRGQYFLRKNKDPQNAWHKAAAVECVDVWDTAYIDGRIADEGARALRANKDRPFFLAVGFNKPHLPFAAPKRYWNLFDQGQMPLPANPHRPSHCPPFAFTPYSELRSYEGIPKQGPISQDQMRKVIHGYYAATAYTDANLGKVIDELHRLNLAERTVVALWADHGWHLGEQDYWGKTTNFEVATRVPLIIHAPGHRPYRSQSIVELLDVYPTIADLCGLEHPAGLEGRSLAPLLGRFQNSWKNAAYSQYPRRQKSTGDQRFMGYSIRTDRYRYTEWLGPDHSVRAQELYDHLRDPHETANIAGEASQKPVTTKMSRRMHRDLSIPQPTTA